MKDWIIQYVKAKDIFTKQLKNYEVGTDQVEFDFGTHKQIYLFNPVLDDSLIEKSQKYAVKTLVVEKTESNFKYLIEHFEALSQINRFIIIFLTKDKSQRILINPKMHAMVADPNTIELGLRAIWDGAQ